MKPHPVPVRVRIVVAILALAVIGALVWWFTRPIEFLYAGTIEATEVQLTAAVASPIAAIEVREGDSVQAQQVLVRLSGEDIQANARLAEKDWRRGQQLFEGGSLTEAQLDRLRTNRDIAVLQADWCTVRAPRAGIILNKYREVGEWARPGTSLLTLGDLNEVWAFVYVPQPEVARLAPGQHAEGLLPELKGKRFPGTIQSIRSEAEFTPKNVQTRDERTRLVYGVKVVFGNPDHTLKPGMSIEVRLPETDRRP